MFESYDSMVVGLRFELIPKKEALEIFEQYHQKVSSVGQFMYLTDLDFDDSMQAYYDICIVPFSDQFEVIKLVQTSAPNYDLTNDQVISWLREKSREFEFRTTVIDFDRIETILITEPKSYKILAEDIYEFCPDVIEQGHDSMKALIKHLQKTKQMWFWWD